MSLQYSTTHRNQTLTDLVTELGAAPYLILYTGAAPANADAAATGTVIAALPCANPVGAVASGVLTFGGITPENATADAPFSAGAYFRLCTDSTGATCLAQGTVGQSGADLDFATITGFQNGAQINITGFTITANGA